MGDDLLCEVRNSASFVLILSQDLFASWWCALELREAVMWHVPIILVRYAGSRWQGAEFPPATVLDQWPPELRGALEATKALQHSDAHYESFIAQLQHKLGAKAGVHKAGSRKKEYEYIGGEALRREPTMRALPAVPMGNNGAEKQPLALSATATTSPTAAAKPAPAPAAALTSTATPLANERVEPAANDGHSPAQQQQQKQLQQQVETQRVESTPHEPLGVPEGNPLICAKLANPSKVLSVEESITVLTTCVAFGAVQAKRAAANPILLIIGNTGAGQCTGTTDLLQRTDVWMALCSTGVLQPSPQCCQRSCPIDPLCVCICRWSGKSTTANYMSGCTMQSVSPKSLGIKARGAVVTVLPRSAGGAMDELMPIGHCKTSKTFMPQIEAPSSAELAGILFVDCPGFLDSRGAEINIANAVNIRAAIFASSSVRVLLLINDHSLQADRGRGLREIVKICGDLFGTKERLLAHKQSLLIGITQCAAGQSVAELREWFADDAGAGSSDAELLAALAERVFAFDPLERDAKAMAADGWWNRAEMLARVTRMDPITDHRHIFSTVLTSDDEARLLQLSDELAKRIDTACQSGQYHAAAVSLQHLTALTVIDHVSIERLLHRQHEALRRHVDARTSAYKQACHFEHFDAARRGLIALRTIGDAFANLHPNLVSVGDMEAYLIECQERNKRVAERESAWRQQLDQAQLETSETLRLLEVQRSQMEERMREQEQTHARLLADVQAQVAATQAAHEQIKLHMAEEMTMRLQSVTAELAAKYDHASQAEMETKLADMRHQLQAEYDTKLRAAERTKDEVLQQQKRQEAELEQQQRLKEEELRHEIITIQQEQQRKRQDADLVEQQRTILRKDMEPVGMDSDMQLQLLRESKTHVSHTEEDPCPVCNLQFSFYNNRMLHCDGCSVHVHQDCYGVTTAELSAGDWFCYACASDERKQEPQWQPRCILCPVQAKGHAFFRVYDLEGKPRGDGHEWAHVTCAVRVSKTAAMTIRGRTRNGLFFNRPPDSFGSAVLHLRRRHDDEPHLRLRAVLSSETTRKLIMT